MAVYFIGDRMMDTQKLTRRLNSIGKAAFIKHFFDFKAYASGQILKEACIDRIILAKTSNWDGASIRCSNAKLIFEANMQNKALEIVVNAKRVPNDIIQKAKNLLGKS